jgi:hypothetical protein
MDKHSLKDSPLGSKENPISVSSEESSLVKQWAAIIDVKRMDPRNFLTSAETLHPWLDLSQKLSGQVNALLIGIAALKKQQKSEEKIDAVMARLRPILALKEILDIYVSERCEQVLDNLECGNFDYACAKVAESPSVKQS